MNYPDDNIRKPQVPGPQGAYTPGPQGPYGAVPPGPYAPGAFGPYGASRGSMGMQDLNPDANSRYKLTREELQAIRECNRESFFGRCVPLMASLGLGAYYGVHLGYLKPNSKYGAGPKVFLGLIVGFIGGKLSYTRRCEDKILALPGGRLKESILARRKAKDGVLSSFSEGVYNDVSYAMPYVGGSLQQSEAKSIAELDTDRPYDSFDDSFRPNQDNQAEQLPIPPPSRAVTYDELRSRNRDEYDSRRKLYRSGPLDDYAPYSGAFAPPAAAPRDIGSSPVSSPPVQPIQSPQDHDATQLYSTQPKLPPQRKNLYGDVVEK